MIGLETHSKIATFKRVTTDQPIHIQGLRALVNNAYRDSRQSSISGVFPDSSKR